MPDLTIVIDLDFKIGIKRSLKKKIKKLDLNLKTIHFIKKYQLVLKN